MRWKKLASRVLVAALALILIVVVGALIWVHTAGFKRFVIQKIADATELSTGEQLTVQELAIHWTRLSADVYGLELRKPSMPEPPFLLCKHVYVSVRVLWRPKFVLNDVVVDDPVLHVLIKPNGENNLPYSRRASSESTADRLINLGIRHFRLNSGLVDYNEQKIPISADLRNVNAAIAFNVAADAYQGSFAYDHGTVSAPHFIPVEHALQMTFDAMRTTFHIAKLNLLTGHTRFTVQGTLSDYAHPRIEATYQASIFTPDLARTLNVHSLPVGQVSTAGTIQYQYAAQVPFLQAIGVAGRLDSADLRVHTGGIVADPRDVRAAYTLAHGDIRATDIAAQLLGGTVRGTFTMRDFGRKPRSTVQAYLADASLAGLTRSLAARQAQSVGLSGRVNATVEAAWIGTIDDAVAHVRATIASPPAPPSPKVIPVNGSLDVRYDGPRDVATFAPSTLETGSTKVSFNGTLSRDSSIAVQANARDLHELMELISSLQPRPIAQPSSLASADLRGSANFSGRIMGGPKAPRIQGQLTGTDIAVKSTTFPAIEASLAVDASHIAIQNAHIKGPSKEQLTLSGRAGLEDWAFNRESQLSIQANASGIELEQIEQLANTRVRVNGELSANASVHGTSEHPAGVGSIEITEPRAGNAVKKLAGPKKLATIHLESDGNEVHAIAQLESPGGPVSANVTYAPRTEQYSGRIEAPNIDLSKLQSLVARGVPFSGQATLEANGSGTIKNPQLDARLTIPDFHIQQQSISNIVAQLNLGGHRAGFSLNSTVVGGYAQANGDVTLLDNYPAKASVNIRALPIGPLLASYVPTISGKLHGQTELHATLSGPLKKPGEIKADIQIPTLDLTYNSVRMGLVEPMRINYANGTASIAKTEIKGTGTDLTLQGTIPLKNPKALDVAADGSINLGELESLEPGWQTSGRVLLHIATREGPEQPIMQGQIEIQDATLLTDTMPFAFESLNGKIGLNGTRLEINQLQATMGGGTLSATGFFDYGHQKSFDLKAVAKTVRLRYPTGIRTVLGAELNLTGTTAAATLNGRVVVDRLSFTQNFDMAALIGEFNTQTPSVAPSGFQQNVKLNIAVASSQSLDVSSSKVSIGGNFNLTVGGTLGTPVTVGRVTLTQGEIFFMGKRYDLQSGTVEFANPIRTEPVLNIYANTTVNQYKITINFIGPLDRLITHYTSDPPLAQADIIHLIAFGNTAEAAASVASTPASLAAESAVANQVTSVVSGKLEKLTGISQISIDPLIPNTVSNPGSQIAIQERVSGNLLVTYATDVTNTQSQTIEVQYRTSKNIKISIIRDYNGGYGLDIRFHKTF